MAKTGTARTKNEEEGIKATDAIEAEIVHGVEDILAAIAHEEVRREVGGIVRLWTVTPAGKDALNARLGEVEMRAQVLREKHAAEVKKLEEKLAAELDAMARGLGMPELLAKSKPLGPVGMAAPVKAGNRGPVGQKMSKAKIRSLNNEIRAHLRAVKWGDVSDRGRIPEDGILKWENDTGRVYPRQ